jgi:hypothetical protein
VAIDLKEFVTSPRNNKYLLVVVDVCTRFCFLRPLPDKSATSVAQALFVLFCDVGFPRILQSDNGTEFVNAILSAMVDTTQIDQRLITAYHPRANGLAERWVQSASNIIYKELSGRATDWDLYHSAAQFFLNTKVSQRHKSTPYSLMFARPVNGFTNYSTSSSALLSEEEMTRRLNYMTSVVYPAISSLIAKFVEKEGSKFSKNNKLTFFQAGAMVMVLDELRSVKSQPRYTGPFTVVRRTQGGSYVLRGPDGTEYARPPSSLKLVSHSAANNETISAVVDKILDHGNDDSTGKKTYLVQWTQKGPEFNEWVKESDFDDLTPINAYWQAKTGTKPRSQRPKAVKPKATRVAQRRRLRE